MGARWGSRRITTKGVEHENNHTKQKESIEKERGFRMGAGARGVDDGSTGAEGDSCRRRDRFIALLCRREISLPRRPRHISPTQKRSLLSLLPLSRSLSFLCLSHFPFVALSLSLSFSNLCSAFFDRGNSLLYLARALSRFWEGEKKRLKWQQGIHLYHCARGCVSLVSCVQRRPPRILLIPWRGVDCDRVWPP